MHCDMTDSRLVYSVSCARLTCSFPSCIFNFIFYLYVCLYNSFTYTIDKTYGRYLESVNKVYGSKEKHTFWELLTRTPSGDEPLQTGKSLGDQDLLNYTFFMAIFPREF